MKGLTSALSIFLLLLILIAFPAASLCAEMPIRVVESEGSAIVTDNDRARARSEAVRDALQKAVVEVASAWLLPGHDPQQSDLLREQIYKKAEGFIQDYRVISESVSQDLFTVVIKASVLADNVENDLRGLGLGVPKESQVRMSTISLVIRGIGDYASYSRCRSILREGKTGIREIILREASWGLARFDVMAEASVPVLSGWLHEKMGADIRYQDEKTLEVDLR